MQKRKATHLFFPEEPDLRAKCEILSGSGLYHASMGE